MKKEFLDLGKNVLVNKTLQVYRRNKGGFDCEDDPVLYVCVYVFAHTGQSYGCGGCPRPSGDHGEHAGLRGLSVR